MELGKQTRGQMTKSLGAGLKHSEYSGSDLEMLQWVFVFQKDFSGSNKEAKFVVRRLEAERILYFHDPDEK